MALDVHEVETQANMVAAPTTLDELLAQVEQRRAEQLRAKREKGIAAVRAWLEAQLSQQTLAALALEYRYDLDSIELHGHGARFVVDGKDFFLNFVVSDNFVIGRCYLMAPSPVGVWLLPVFSSEFETTLLTHIADWRTYRRVNGQASAEPVSLPKVARTGTRIVSDQPGGTRIVELSAGSECGALSQYTAVLASFSAYGEVKIARIGGNNRQKTEVTDLSTEILDALIPAYAAWKETQEATASTKKAPADDVPF